MTKKKMLLIVNPCSGKTNRRKTIDELISKGLMETFDITVRTTRFTGDATDIVQEMSDNFDLIACAGGDGTLNEVVDGSMKIVSKKPIAYIPNGTTNDFSKSIGIPQTIHGISALLSGGDTNFCDVGSFNDRYFICTASFGYGVNASLATSQKLKNNFGHLAYIMSAVSKLTDIKSYEMRIECNDKVYEGRYIFGSVTNTTSVGGVFKLHKDTVRLNDGKFEVILIPAVKNIAQVPVMLNKLRTQQYDNENVIFLQTNNITFKSKELVSWLIDGENAGNLNDVQIVNHQRAIELCVPKKRSLRIQSRQK